MLSKNDPMHFSHKINCSCRLLLFRYNMVRVSCVLSYLQRTLCCCRSLGKITQKQRSLSNFDSSWNSPFKFLFFTLFLVLGSLLAVIQQPIQDATLCPIWACTWNEREKGQKCDVTVCWELFVFLLVYSILSYFDCLQRWTQKKRCMKMQNFWEIFNEIELV